MDYQWLEKVDAPECLNWSKIETQKTQSFLQDSPIYEDLENRIRNLLSSQDKTPQYQLISNFIYYTHRTPQKPLGTWKRISIDQYTTDHDQWETLIDFDDYSDQNKQKYVLRSFNVCATNSQKCLLSISPGGQDATYVKEYDLESKTFVQNGFKFAISKNSYCFVDEETVYFTHNETSCGYGKDIYKIKRGQNHHQAVRVLEGTFDLVASYSRIINNTNIKYQLLTQCLDFYNFKQHLLLNDEVFLIPCPLDSHIETIHNGYAYILINSPLDDFRVGSLVRFKVDPKQIKPNYELVWEPQLGQSFLDLLQTESHLYFRIMNQVQTQVYRFSETKNSKAAFNFEKLSLPDYSTIHFLGGGNSSQNLLLSVTQFQSPTQILKLHDQSKECEVLFQGNANFDSDEVEVSQKFATSQDGTPVPYFLIHKKGLELNGQNPTVQYGYGGFKSPLLPTYLSIPFKTWIEFGGVYVYANIRGGNEFGPEWHTQTLKLNRQKCFDDFIAVSESLIQNKITNPKKLGIWGGSNGGLLVGACFTQRPDLYKSVICEVPLLDMERYHLLLAGKSWAAEYGTVDESEELKKFILSYSPFHNLQENIKYPEVLFVTSTKDDRVHPGHARKMFAKMKDLEQNVHLLENQEGGHGRALSLEDQIKTSAYEWVFFHKTLKGNLY